MTPMDAVRTLVEAHADKLALAALAILAMPTSGKILGGSDLEVSATAPEKADGLSVAVSADSGLLGACPDEAELEIRRGDFIVYPKQLGEVDMDGCSGTAHIPYERFASQNGRYTVEVDYGDQTTQTDVSVRKVVNWVYVRAFPNEDEERTRFDVAFDITRGQPLTSSVFTSGTLQMEIRFEECAEQGLEESLLEQDDTCNARSDVVFRTKIPIEQEASTHVIVPWQELDADQNGDGQPEEGAYNVTATFHSDVAKANNNVPLDPTVYNEDPPATWFEVTY